MKKRIGSLLLALALCLCLFPVSAFAADEAFVIEDEVLRRYNGVTSIDDLWNWNDSLKTAAIHYAAVGGFGDVKSGAYYADAVKWAVANGITNGTSATAFSPNATCTQGHILTFLWRAKGEPKPTGTVTGTQYYAAAAQWAKEQGLTDSFSAGADCTRAMVVTYLWKLAGGLDVGTPDFTDVPTDAAYAKAVAWAVKEGITNGTSATTFSPEQTCTRAQIVTFLYRAYAKSDQTALLSSIAYYGDPAQCAMTANQALAFAETIEAETAALETEYALNQNQVGPGEITAYAALIDIGNGNPVLFYCGGLNTDSWEGTGYDGTLRSAVIWQYIGGDAAPLAVDLTIDSVKWDGQQLLISERSRTNSRAQVFQAKDGILSMDPVATLSSQFETGEYYMNGQPMSTDAYRTWSEHWRAYDSVGEASGGGAESHIYGMGSAKDTVAALRSYARS